MIHAKVLCVDGLWAVVGSTNFDNRSFGINDEVNLAVSDSAFAERLERDMSADLAESRSISLDEWRTPAGWRRSAHRNCWGGSLSGSRRADVTRLRVATYNIHKCRGFDRRTSPDRINTVIEELQAEILRLQEVVDAPEGPRCGSSIRPERSQGPSLNIPGASEATALFAAVTTET